MLPILPSNLSEKETEKKKTTRVLVGSSKDIVHEDRTKVRQDMK